MVVFSFESAKECVCTVAVIMLPGNGHFTHTFNMKLIDALHMYLNNLDIRPESWWFSKV